MNPARYRALSLQLQTLLQMCLPESSIYLPLAVSLDRTPRARTAAILGGQC